MEVGCAWGWRNSPCHLNQDETPIHHASRKGHLFKETYSKCSKCGWIFYAASLPMNMLKLGMDLNFENNLGGTPLYLAQEQKQDQARRNLSFDICKIWKYQSNQTTYWDA